MPDATAWPWPDEDSDAAGTELQPRFRDPDYALAFARVVMHYAKHYARLENGVLMDGLDALDL